MGASLSSGRKEHGDSFTYSLNTNTRVWPAKRTSFTWPFSLRRTESYAAAIRFRNDIFALLHGGFAAINHQAVLAGLEIGLSDLGVLREVDRFCERLGECWHRHCESGQQGETAEDRIAFHACHHLSDRIESAGKRTIRERVLTRSARTSRLACKTHRSSWTNGRKDCVSTPRGCHRGVFPYKPRTAHHQLHSYRRISLSECFVERRRFFCFFRDSKPISCGNDELCIKFDGGAS
jgi:hypothetical protein